MSTIINNLVIQRDTEPEPSRVVYTNKASDIIVTQPIGRRGTAPRIGKLSEWECYLEAGTAYLANDPKTFIPFEQTITPAMKSKQERAWSVIEPLTKAVPDIFDARFRRTAIARAAKACGAHPDTVRDWLTSYWQGGCSAFALLGSYNNCGAPGKPKPDIAAHSAEGEEMVPAAKRGAKRTIAPGVGCNVTEQMREKFQVAVRLIYFRNKHATLKYTYHSMLERFFPDAFRLTEDGSVKLSSPDAIPTYDQFRYWYRKYEDPLVAIRRKKGQRYFNLNARPLPGNSTRDGLVAGYRYQIDATILDVQIVSSYSGKLRIGRPILYLVVDTQSHSIAGFYVGLENISWYAAMMAIYNCTVDKVAFCKSLGIEIDEDQWPTAGLPSVLLGDRGEMLSKFAEQAALILNIEIENTPPYRADWKGIVERLFGHIQRLMAPFLPGYVSKDSSKRGEEDPKLSAVLTLEDIIQIVVYTIIEHNNTAHRDYPMTPSMIEEGVPPIPTEIWKWSVQNGGGTIYRDPNIVKFALLPSAETSITRHGIRLKGRYYASDQPHIRNAMSNARLNGVKEVTVSYDPQNMDKVFMHDKAARGEFTELFLTSQVKEDLGLRAEVLDFLELKRKQTEAAAKIDSIVTAIQMSKARDSIIETATERISQDEIDAIPKTQLTGNVKANREQEKVLNWLVAHLNAVPVVQSDSHETDDEPEEKFAKKSIYEDDEVEPEERFAKKSIYDDDDEEEYT